MYGFTLNNKHSSALNLYITTKNLPALAQKRYTEETIPNRNGSFKFEDGFNDKVIKLECVLIESDFTLKRLKMREVAEWLSQGGELVLDYETDKYYKVKMLNDITPNIENSIDGFTIVFLAYPLQYSTYVNELVFLENDIYLLTELPLGADLQNTFYVTDFTTGTLNNLGTYEATPIIEIEGTATSISISNITGGMTIQNIAEKTYIDCEKMVCYTLDAYGNKVNKLIDFTGQFITIPAGESNIQIDGTNLNCNVYFNYRNTYL